ncbi:putative F-box family protein [Melia azedarach]|uniref:F-box family protein n=1 Tax=Melia azedarach TaxID=155640 RepID=A0ACC1X1G3_MELAZ|nr:putative F-box family protein [Melia azedarach]
MASPSFAATVTEKTAAISSVHPDVIETHILTRLDGATLASASCVSSQLHSLASKETLWTTICHSTWPSTNTPRLRHIISSFRDGPRSFFSDSFTNPDPASLPATSTSSSLDLGRPSELISAVDIYYKNKLMFSKVVETEIVSGWFKCSPFRVDLLDPKDTVPTRIPHPANEDTCREFAEDFTLSWILIDPIGRRSMNLSTYKPVTVQRHWLSGEVQVRFASVFPGGERRSASEFVQCGIVVTCGGAQGGEMHVREVSLQVEDMYGMNLNGKESIVILEKGLEGKRGNIKGREEEGKRKYEEYMEMKRERKERKLRAEGRMDMLCVAFGVFTFFSLWLFILWR